jgi:cytochrome P450
VGFFRFAREAVEVGGVRLPKGAPVFLLFASANQDEAKFPAPLDYNPRRENLSAHLGFSRGLHYCLGAPQARLEMRVALEVLTRRLPGLRLVPNQEMRYVRSAVLRGLKHLHLEWDPAPAT